MAGHEQGRSRSENLGRYLFPDIPRRRAYSDATAQPDGASRRSVDRIGEDRSICDQERLEHFAGAFLNAAGKLSSTDPLAGTYHSDLVATPAIPLKAKQLLGAVLAAWVFGGMGSWNDLGFDGNDQQEYTELSDELFVLLNQAISVAVSATADAANP